MSQLPKLACLSVDMEPDLRCPQKRIRLLEEDSRLQPFMNMLNQEAVPLTAFVVMSHAAALADRLRVLAENTNTEFAVHSFSHDQTNPASVDEVKRSWDAYGDLWNAEPAGYRSPNCLIDAGGLRNLAEQGFKYDSSIVPSVRFDQYGYNNMSYGRTPFRCEFENGKSLIELPVACMAGIPLPFIFSYIKLLGLPVYRMMAPVMPLPPIVVTYFHPYDLYAQEIAENIPGWKKYAHLRNARRAPELLLKTIRFLKQQNYEFVSMHTLSERMESYTQLPVRTFDA